MKIKKAEFVISNTDINLCPKEGLPEYAFIGRSNVGKSSLINLITGRKKLAKTSGSPGKTQLINHFIINDNWYLVDLPGYGYAKVSKTARFKWEKFISNYLKKRKELAKGFVNNHIPEPEDDKDPFEGIETDDINNYADLYDVPPPETDNEAKKLANQIRKWIQDGRPKP